MAIPAGTIQEKIFDFVYILSMHEAVRREAFPGEKKWLYDFSDPNMLGAKNCVKSYIDRILFGKPFSSQKEHDDFFLETAIKICDCINQSKQSENSDFTFGNAQKLINMVVKHFYIIYYYCKNVREKFVYCHCPMDSRMLEKVYANRTKVPAIFGKYIKKSNIKSSKKGFVDSRSKEDFDNSSGKRSIPERYNDYQEYIREVCESKGMIPIEYDYYMWGEGDMEQMLEEEENEPS